MSENMTRSKLNSRLDELNKMMTEQVHLTDPEKVTDQIASITKFWSALSQEDRDYLNGVRFALESGHQWA
jgi:hypothetical protein